MTSGRVYGRARRDTDFAAQLDDALAESCVGGELCGTERGYRLGGRCADCRRAKRDTR